MTVKCLDKATQVAVVTDFTQCLSNIDEMASFLGVSRRTIIRVLEDHGVEPGIKRRPGARKPRQPIATEAQAILDYVDTANTVHMPHFELHNRQNIAQPKLSFVRRLFNRITTGLSLR